MERVYSGLNPLLVECTNYKIGKYLVRWDVKEEQHANDGMESQSKVASFYQQEFLHKPTLEEVKSLITSWYDEQITARIVEGFMYEGLSVWLSNENQLNYKVAYDMAVQSDGANLPVTFKFYDNDGAEYRTFNTLAEITDFYTAMVSYIQQNLIDGWQEKDRIDWSPYEAALA